MSENESAADSVREYYLAGDPAKQHDFFGIVLLQRINDSIKLIALKELRLDYTVVANYIESLSKKYQVRMIFLDQTGVGNVFLDMLKAKGLTVEGITLSNPKKVEIIETVIRLMQEQRIKLPKNGAKELKIQLQEQERDITESGMIRFKHAGRHDDLFWSFAIGCYGIKQRILTGINYMVVKSKKWERAVNIWDDEFGSALGPGETLLDRAIHYP